MNDGKLIYRNQFSKYHMLMSTVLLLYLLIELLTSEMRHGMLGIVATMSVILIDIVVYGKRIYQKKSIFYEGLRIIEVVILSVLLFGVFSGVSMNIASIMLLITYLELMLEHDITDSYSRIIILLMTGIPTFFYLLYQLLINVTNPASFFEVLSSYVLFLVLAVFIADFVASVIRISEDKVLGLKRNSEYLTQANEALSKQQDKIRKANEELGIQKIKLESAYNKINNTNTETMIQNMIMKYISSSLEITTLLNMITESVMESMALDICVIIIEPGTAGNEEILYRTRTRLGEKPEEMLNKKIALGCMNKYIKAEGTYVDNHVNVDDYPFLHGAAINSLLIIPLMKDEVVQGALICGKQQYEFFHDNIPFFETVVTQLLVAIHNAGLYAKMQQMAIRDSLTGIYNRRQLNVIIDQYSKQAMENSLCLSVVLFDIDHFKRINDTYGHLFGDEVIKAIAGYAEKISIKYTGIVARYGGEEFVLVLPGKSVKESKLVVKELQQQINDMELHFEGQVVTARVSIGLSSYPETCTHITELLNRADSAMYYAKNNGRNQLAVDSDEIYEQVN